MDRRASLGINSISSLKRKYVESAEPTNADMTKLVPSDQEADLLSAIFELGLKNASPKILLNLMSPLPGLRSENIKSHLQKYRIEVTRGEMEFLDCYGHALRGKFHEWLRENGLSMGTGIGNAPFTSPDQVTSSAQDSVSDGVVGFDSWHHSFPETDDLGSVGDFHGQTSNDSHHVSASFEFSHTDGDFVQSTQEKSSSEAAGTSSSKVHEANTVSDNLLADSEIDATGALETNSITAALPDAASPTSPLAALINQAVVRWKQHYDSSRAESIAYQQRLA